MLKNSRIITRLSLGFSLLLLGTLLLGAIGARNVVQLGSLATDIFEHPFTVTSSIHEVRAEFLVAEKILAALAHAATPAEVDRLNLQLVEQGRIGDRYLAVVRERFLGEQQDVVQLSEALARWRSTRNEIVVLARNGRRAEAIALHDERADRLGDVVLKEVTDVMDFAANKAASFEKAAARTSREAQQDIATLFAVIMVAGIALAIVITRGITRPLDDLRNRMTRLAEGDLSVEVPYRDADNELGAMASAVQVLKEAALRLEGQRWVKANTSELATTLQAAANTRDFAQTVVSKLVPLLQGGAGAFYHRAPDGEAFELLGSWGLKPRPDRPTAYKPGESLVGQCAQDGRTIVLAEVPDDYLRIASGTGEAVARTILVAPVMSKGAVTAVLEIAAFQPFSADQQALIDEALPIVALTLEILQRSVKTRLLLEQTQEQAEELRASEEELRAQTDQIQASNEELRASEEELKVQHEELQAINEELAEKSRVLEEARREADRRALELGTASRYKSEFLANMSHELRTPLNSLLILSRCLSENEEGNLLPDQVESAKIIAESGAHLLQLINDILDLSKVEAGKMDVRAVEIPLLELRDSLLRRFRRLAEVKGLELTVTADADLPAAIVADPGKVDQILNNLVANALKFTERGSVTVHLRRHQQQLAIDIVDTGIGIAAGNIESIFRAFEQADGSSSRRYGGTGLGLTISRKLAQLMGGNVTVSSSEGQGSRFSLLLPIVGPNGPSHAKAPAATAAPVPASSSRSATTDDDLNSLSPNDEIMLVIEDDPSFARIVRDLARKDGFKCLMAGNGKTGLDLARRYRPTGIILDIGLPGMDGWAVMQQLKAYPETRQIPVHFMSATDAGLRGLEMGAVGFFTKPVTREQIVGAFEQVRRLAHDGVRRLLLVGNDPATRQEVTGLLAAEQIAIVEVNSGERALARLRDDEPFDCMVLDLDLPDMDGHSLLKRCGDENVSVPPVVIYSARELSESETRALREYTDSIIVKGARSPERLQDDVRLFLHSVQARLPEAQQRMLRGLRKPGAAEGPLVLVVDDDMRNTFALSKLLRSKGMRVVMAQDGRTALDQLETVGGIDVVLMDMMMPGMDGYQAITEIRNQDRFRSLPVIALTARAMMGDREKCLEAGANDYVAKPVDVDALLAAIHQLVPRPTA
jgi:CheY-like chemotaxis protein/signal transduction histidine kinase/HAMP domain-containing protein